LTFLVTLTYILTVTELADNAAREGAKDLFDDFRQITIVIIGFYFRSEAAIGVTKAIMSASASPQQARQIRRSDRDLAPPP
jgi:hypothetical protein